MYLKNARELFPIPWLCPLAKYVRPVDNRKSSRRNIRIVVINLAVSRSRDRVVIVSYQAIHVWSLSHQEELFRISIGQEAFVNCAALSEDTKIIVSGHRDSTFCRWNMSTGDPFKGLRQFIRKDNTLWLSEEI